MGKNRGNRYDMLTWAIRLEGRALWSENANAGTAVYGETLRKFGGIEYRRWDPSRSKLGAGIMRTKRINLYFYPRKAQQYCTWVLVMAHQ